jgi:hypothetical protein
VCSRSGHQNHPRLKRKRNLWLTAPPSIGELALVFFFFSGSVTVSKPTTSELAKDDVGHGDELPSARVTRARQGRARTHTCMACDRRSGERAAATELTRARAHYPLDWEEILVDGGRDSLAERRTFSFRFRGDETGRKELPRACRPSMTDRTFQSCDQGFGAVICHGNRKEKTQGKSNGLKGACLNMDDRWKRRPVLRLRCRCESMYRLFTRSSSLDRRTKNIYACMFSAAC